MAEHCCLFTICQVANDSDIADLLAALKPGSVVAADGLYAGMQAGTRREEVRDLPTSADFEST